jgi:autophagy-related protein 17
MIHLLGSLGDHSHNMAELLTSLTKHFDLCVTAVRTTEGGAALARRKAAEVTMGQDGESVSISGLITEEELHATDLEPITHQDRADMMAIVVGDASEVDDVVQEINERLAAMESEFRALEERVGQVRTAYSGTLGAFQALEEIGAKMPSYVGAESEFLVRWEDEKASVFSRLDEMDQLGSFYDGYANAYDGLILEVERRRIVDEKARSIWRRAKETVDKLADEDYVERKAFMQDAGEYLPTDLWNGMDAEMAKWEVRLVPASSSSGNEIGTPTLSRSVVDAARERLARR